MKFILFLTLRIQQVFASMQNRLGFYVNTTPENLPPVIGVPVIPAATQQQTIVEAPLPPLQNTPPLALPGQSLNDSRPVESPDNVFFSSTPFDITQSQQFLQILHYNPKRKYLLIQNTTIASLNNDGTIQIIFDDAPAQGTASIKRSVTLSAGGAYEPIKCPTNPITIYTTSALAEGVVVEGQ